MGVALESLSLLMQNFLSMMFVIVIVHVGWKLC